MALLHRRGPRYARPWLFVGLLLAGSIVLAHAVGADFSVSLQTGNVFLLVTLPWQAHDQDVAALLGATLGTSMLLGAFVVGTQGARATDRQLALGVPAWRRAMFRVYPTTFLLGAFLLYFGLVFLFDASVYGDDVPGGFAGFVYLDYAGLLDRPLVSLVGFAIALVGFTLVTRLCWESGLDRPDPVWAPEAAPGDTANGAPSSAP